MVHLYWTSDKNAQQTTKSETRMAGGGGISGANLGFAYVREREPKKPYEGDLWIGPGDSSTLELPTSKIFVTISSPAASDVFNGEGTHTHLFKGRMFTAQNCKGYTIREKKFKNIEDSAKGQFVCVCMYVCVFVVCQCMLASEHPRQHTLQRTLKSPRSHTPTRTCARAHWLDLRGAAEKAVLERFDQLQLEPKLQQRRCFRLDQILDDQILDGGL